MKLTKRILAMALALMMVLSLSVSAFASEGHNHTITINNPNKDYGYTAYMIFSGDLNDKGVLSNIQWGDGVNGDALLADLQKLDAFKDCKNVKDVATVLSKLGNMDDPVAIEFAKIAADHKKGTGHAATWDEAQQKYFITGLEDGYYIVINDQTPANAENISVSRYVLEVVRDITVSHKGHYPTVDKKIREGEELVDYNAKGVGKVENYVITGTMPLNIAQYKEYEYVFVDTLSKGLTYNAGSMTVTVNGVDVTKYMYINVTEYDEVNGTTITVGADILALAKIDKNADPDVFESLTGTITKDTKVVLTYSATVNENAVVGIEGNPNDVYLEYDHNPNDDTPNPAPEGPTPERPTPSGKTPKDEVKTFVTELKITKYDGAGQILTGAEFTLTGTVQKTAIVKRYYYKLAETAEEIAGATHWKLKDKEEYTNKAPVFVDDNPEDDVNPVNFDFYDLPADYDQAANKPTHILAHIEEVVTEADDVIIKAYVGTDGVVTFSGLGPGEYTLTESVTPSGFNTIAPINFEIVFNAKTQKFDVTGNDVQVETTNNTLYANIVNVAGTTLPSTGGMGTTLFYIFGGLLFVGAAVLLVTKKRMAM